MAPDKAKAAKDILKDKPYRAIYLEYDRDSPPRKDISEYTALYEDKMPYYIPNVGEVAVITNPGGDITEWVVKGKGYHIADHAVIIMVQRRSQYENETRTATLRSLGKQ